MDEDRLAELETEYQSAEEDVKEDCGEEAWDGGGWLEVAISIASLYPQEVAEEFLRRKCGYVPQMYRQMTTMRRT
jgi:hypothetical protein